MNKSLLVGAVLGAVGVTAGGAVATYSLVKSGPEYAQVLAVQPVKTQIKTPREVCKDVTVTRQRPVQDQHQIAGTVVGLSENFITVEVANDVQLRVQKGAIASVLPKGTLKSA